MRNQKPKRSIIKRLFIFILYVFITVVFITASAVAYGWFKYDDDLKQIKTQANEKIASIHSETFRTHEQSIIYDKNNQEMERLTSSDYEYVSYEEMNPLIPKAFIAIEDQRFEQHKGVDPKALIRAGVAYVKNKGVITQGGSTITQQLVKNIFLSLDQTFTRKFEEMIIAYELEKRYTKEQIIEFYINNINYANGNFSFESASQYYFSKPSKELSLAEITFIAAIPNNPSYYNPLKNMENTIERQKRILNQMKMVGFITEVEFNEALNVDITLNVQKRDSVQFTYATNYAIHDAVEILMRSKGFRFENDFTSDAKRQIYEKEYNKKYEEVYEELRSGGYRIYTSIDPKKQAVVQKAVDKGLNQFTSKDKETNRFETQGAAVIINNETGMVEAIVGGRSQEGVTDWFNRGYQAYRQPGSSIKPLVAYTPAFENGMLAFSKIEDKFIKDGPQNAQGRFYGWVDLRYATEMSLNTVAYQLVIKNTPEKSLEYLKKMEFSKIVDNDNHAGIGVGGFTYGVTPLELAGGFSTLARNGSYLKPTAIRKIENATQETLYELTPKAVQVYKSGSAYIMTDVLMGALSKKHASGYGLGVEGMPTAGKTGTTNDSKDGWFSGYTPYYTAVVWVGNDTPETIKRLYGATYPGGIWKDFMDQIHDGLEKKEFTMPDDVHKAYVSYSGEVSEREIRGWDEELVTDSYIANAGWEASEPPAPENGASNNDKGTDESDNHTSKPPVSIAPKPIDEGAGNDSLNNANEQSENTDTQPPVGSEDPDVEEQPVTEELPVVPPAEPTPTLTEEDTGGVIEGRGEGTIPQAQPSKDTVISEDSNV